MGYFNFYIIKKILNSLFRIIRKNKKFIIIFIIFVCILFIKEKCFAITSDYDVEYDFVREQETIQNEFAFFSFYPYYGNTEFWTNCILPVYEDIATGRDYYIQRWARGTYTEYYVTTFNGYIANATTVTWHSNLTNETVTLRAKEFLPNVNGRTDGYTTYSIKWYPSTNSGTLTNVTNNSNKTIPYVLTYVKTDAMLEFIKLYNTGGGDYADYLNTISNYLNTISSVDTNILNVLNTISTNLAQVSSNTSTNYSQQIGQISNKISDILTDNDTIISQNSQMIQQQEEINDNLEQVSDDVQELKDTITDDTVTSTASDLPSTNVNNPTENGIDNIFQSIYNAFCVGNAQDIVFPIPFTDKNITLSPYYVRDMLNNNNAGWVYSLIQAFWGYLIGRYIITDISKKIDKIKSGDIENVENSNIKEEML